MSHRLINLNPDLKHLWDEGYEIEIHEGFLIMHHVPYLNSLREIKYGQIVSALDLAGDITQRPNTHALYFVGEPPCDQNGLVMSAIINSPQVAQLTSKITASYYLSSKPAGGYPDYYQKMTTYANAISAPAKSVDDSVTEKTFRVIESDETESVFNYFDTNSSRAKINIIADKLADQKIAIIGVGGTGSYILDLVAKTPVEEIHLFDGDTLKSHNAFRAPGAPSIEGLRERPTKTDYFAGIYSNMHRHIVSHPYHVDRSNLAELAEMSFVFLCVDDGTAKKLIVDYLLARDISFIDVGMGLENVDDKLIGTVRVTTATAGKNDHLGNRIPFAQELENEYSTNIQIADLNALNAAMAVIKWKKLSGFYHDFDREHHSTYTVDSHLLTSDDNEA